MALIDKRLDKIREKILEDTFIEGKGLGNEISFYIFDYDPKDELKVRDHINYLKSEFKSKRYNRKIVEFDLYEMFIELAKEKNIFDQIFIMEEKKDKEYLERALKAFLKPEIFLNKIQKEKENNNVLFITGVGKIYPFVRSHNILENLQEILENNTPVILFYPGQYNEQDLQLFNLLEGQNYYRAFQLIDNERGELL